MTGENALIIGYGRAGRRHEKILKDLAIESYKYDPFVFPAQATGEKYGHNYLEFLLNKMSFDYAVICTPPDSHLEYIRLCLDGRIGSILCEKPLCDIGQLDEAKALPMDAPVMVAYNYNYHPCLIAYKGKICCFSMTCSQHRADLPEWGLLLDHCSHDLDIARMVTGHDLDIIRAEETIIGTPGLSDDTIYSWQIETCLGIINETVTTEETERKAEIRYGRKGKSFRIEINPDPTMFTNMWLAFLAGDYHPNLTEAIKTQELIEQCYRLNKECQ